jgi:hypothetical protein
VDTYDQGKITFRLALDKIELNAQARDEACPSQFEQLSQKLNADFGVKTRFTHVDGVPLGASLHKNEKEEPGDNNLERCIDQPD